MPPGILYILFILVRVGTIQPDSSLWWTAPGRFLLHFKPSSRTGFYSFSDWMICEWVILIIAITPSLRLVIQRFIGNQNFMLFDDLKPQLSSQPAAVIPTSDYHPYQWPSSLRGTVILTKHRHSNQRPSFPLQRGSSYTIFFAVGVVTNGLFLHILSWNASGNHWKITITVLNSRGNPARFALWLLTKSRLPLGFFTLGPP